MFQKQVALGTMGEHFEADQDDDWLVEDNNTVTALKHGYRVAEIAFLSPTMVNIIVPDVHRLVRQTHMREFNPQTAGFNVCTQFDWHGDKLRPDLETTFEIGEVPGLHMPKRPMPKATFNHIPKVKASI